MRLIDVDKIIITRQDYVGALTLKERLQRLLNFQPIVNAIPIEWIENWLETCIPHYDYDRMTYIADVYDMLDDWMEENK